MKPKPIETKRVVKLPFAVSKRFLTLFCAFVFVFTFAPNIKIFASTTITPPKTLPYTYDGNTYSRLVCSGLKCLYASSDAYPFAYADMIYMLKSDENTAPTNYCYFDCTSGCPDIPTNCGINYIFVDSWSNCFSDMKATENVEQRGDYNYNSFRCFNGTQGTTTDETILLYANFSGVDENTEGIISPVYPTDCSFTSTSTPLNFNARGTIYIPASSTATWFRISVIANEFTTGTTTYFSTSTSLTGGMSYNYVIPVSLPDGAWKISYLLQGVENTQPRTALHFCDNTGIGTALPLPVWKEITELEFLGLENCSGYPLLERIMCDIKNALKRIFVPSNQNLQQFQDTISGLKQKAPMNYLTTTKDFFNSVSNGINSEQTLSFKILNQSGNVDFSFWDNQTTIAGQSQKFSDIFRLFFTFILVLGFMVWSISYVRKVFK